MFRRVANTVGFLYTSELIRIKLPLPQLVYLALSRQLEGKRPHLRYCTSLCLKRQ